MAEHDSDRFGDELVPLRTAAKNPLCSPEDRWLAAGLSALYPTASETGQDAAAPGWERLQDHALQLARRRRRSYLLRELLGSGAPRPLPLLVAAALLLVLFAPADHPAPPPTPAVTEFVVATPRAALASDAQRIRLLSGAEVQVDHATLAIEQEDRSQTRIVLTAGVVRLHVPPLPGRGKLMVLTKDAEVIVHGTRFTVRKVDPASTTVAVDEGLVEVRPQGGGRSPIFLRPGETATVPSLVRYKAEISARAGRLIDAGTCEDPEHSIDRYLELAPPEADVSAAQYLKGFCAAQRKASDEALRWFERAAATSQDKIRADNALARLATLRAEESEQAGAEAWSRYLARFPQGLHRQSAERFLAGLR